MFYDITEEEMQLLYKSKEEQLADEIECVWYDKDLGISLSGARPSLSTMRHLQYMRKGYSHFFDIDYIVSKLIIYISTSCNYFRCITHHFRLIC